MTMMLMRAGAAAFVLLSAGVAANMMLLQTESPRAARAAKAAPPRAEAKGGELKGRPATSAASAQTAGPQAKSAATSADAPRGSDLVRQLQRELAARGYETPTDGTLSLVTRAAIMAYEHDRGLPLSAEATPQLLKVVTSGTARVMGTPTGRGIAGKEAEQVIRTVQQSLTALGYAPGKADGKAGDETVRAIREFEMDQSLPETGRISGQLVARLAGIAGQGRLAGR